MRNLFTILSLLFALNLSAQTKTEEALIKRIEQLEQKLETQSKDFKEQLEKEEKLNDRTSDSISKQLDASAYNLSSFSTWLAYGGIIFSIFLALLGWGLGRYVNMIEKKVSNTYELSKQLHESTKEENQKLINGITHSSENIKDVERKVNHINELIENNLTQLYLNLRKEEKNIIIAELINEPTKIVDRKGVLLYSELDDSDFRLIVQAYSNYWSIPQEPYTYSIIDKCYNEIFFKHFIAEAITDGDLRIIMASHFLDIFKNSDVKTRIKTTKELFQFISQHYITDYKDEIMRFLSALKDIPKDLKAELLDVAFKSISNRDMQFEAFNIITDYDLRTEKINYGKLLFKKYGTTISDGYEKGVVERLKQLIQDVESDKEKRGVIDDLKRKREEHLVNKALLSKELSKIFLSFGNDPSKFGLIRKRMLVYDRWAGDVLSQIDDIERQMFDLTTEQRMKGI